MPSFQIAGKHIFSGDSLNKRVRGDASDFAHILNNLLPIPSDCKILWIKINLVGVNRLKRSNKSPGRYTSKTKVIGHLYKEG